MRLNKRLPAALSGLLLSTALLAGCSTSGTDETTTTTVSSAAASTTTSTSSDSSSSSSSDSSTTAETISNTAEAAQAFLATLSTEEQDAVLYDYDAEEKSTGWSNFPVTFVQRSGVNLTDLTEEQQAAALNVLKNLLNNDAYQMIEDIMASDQYLNDESNTTEDSLGQYYIAFFGDPSSDSDWSIQFGGHHIGINATFSDGAITFAPTHLGTQPSEWTNEDGETVAALSNMYETAFAFYDSLTEEQQAQLYQGEELDSMVCAPGSTCDYPTGTGLKGSDLTDEQKELLLDVIANWVGLADEETTETELDAIRETLDDTYINWSGATEYDTSTGDGIYFQISGPKVYIEFANQQGSAGADIDGVITAGWGHIHTIYRDPTNDYANSVTQEAASGMMGGGPGGNGGEMPSGDMPTGEMRSGTPSGAPSN
ncbi:hypothetical protein J433_04070 [Corynebacterium glutamicum MT]|uniref:DUF3500 domain-containing protein n=1 Tax=Corynebacterium glutamicum TaxID=1718 RepID=A0AB36IGP7_CORGT|nr:DUF3500 domain-containing protein [Corynebacterium glutamicum]AGN20421.1 hypothetical protein C624_14270 [Corynebacterium glutamicum SCgG1]AGN23445.1 hypothetical protein C629_14275 [Corynebacterium glutamicum SCgG2]EGV39580.1 hypothetical protein CgS9114_12332 [Corynebacterium glutamicum S9114]EOA65436.1 hypothetical protein J433_04070 [Corynebacterium glutamicum MT]EPP39502.1 hypothetical protein A583_13798 [Corynebacterium glutamicum Z188]